MKAEGSSIGMGVDQVFTMNFSVPGLSAGQVRNDITAGGYYAIGLFSGQLSLSDSEILQRRAQQLDNFIAGGGDRLSDDGLGEQLYLSAMGYFWQVDRQTEVVAAQEDVVFAKLPGEGIFALALSVSTFFGIPRTVEVTGTQIDVDRVIVTASSKSGNEQAAVNFVGGSGSVSSGFEHAIIEQLYGVDGISAIKAIQLANDQGLKIYNVTDANLSSALQALQVSNIVKADIQNAINAGKQVQIPERELQVNQWAGVGYVISDPATGSAAYMISGGLNGGSGTSDQGLSGVLGKIGASTLGFVNCITHPNSAETILETIKFLLVVLAALKATKIKHPIMLYIGIALLLIIILQVIISCIVATIDRRMGERFV